MAERATIHVMEAVNLVCGDGGNGRQPGHSTHLELQELKLPGLEETYVDHNPGGSMVGVEVPLGMNRLESTFNLAGWQPEVMKMLANSRLANQVFTAYGLLRDRRTGRPNRAVARMEGRLGRVNPTPFRRGDLNAHEYAIRAIVHYTLTVNIGGAAEQLIRWDFFSSVREIGGEDLNREMNRILSIPSGTTTPGGGSFSV